MSWVSDEAKERFIPFHESLGRNGGVLADYNYWGQEVVMLELQEWCKEYDTSINGLVIDFPDEQTYVMFKLRWL